MATSRVAVRYAKVLIEVAQSKNASEQVANDMQTISQAINESAELQQFLTNPVIKDSAKKNTLDKIFASSSIDTKSLFDLLNNNHRFEILPQIAHEYIALHEDAKGIVKAYVTTATPLDDKLKTKILDKVKQLTPKPHIEIINQINPEIIGGFIIKIGDTQYNASITDKLNKLKRELVKN